MSKNKKNIKAKDNDVLVDDKLKAPEEETEKESSTLSEGVLDAFDEEITPTDPLIIGSEDLEGEEIGDDEEEDIGIDSGDYKPDDEW